MVSLLPGAALITAKGRNPDIDNVHSDVLQRWERVQKRFGRDLPINSGFRDKNRNRRAKGAKKSQHMHGKALDIDVRILPKDERLRLIRIASDEGFTGVGVYNNAIHLDTGGRRHWGPDFRGKSTPKWARETLAVHMNGGFKTEGRAPEQPAPQLADASGGTSDYFREQFLKPAQAENAPLDAPGQTAPKISPAAPNAPSGESEYFRKNFLEPAQAEKNGPSVPTTAPVAPAGLDAKADPGFIQRTYNAGRELIVGDAEYDVPEIENSPGAIRDIAGESGVDFSEVNRALFAADGEDAMANIVKKYAPSAEIIADKNGNKYVKLNGETFALDKSGLSGRDATEVVKGIATAIMTLGGAKAGAALAGNVGRMAGAGVGAGGEQVLEQAASEYYGGGQGMDYSRALIGGAFGIGGEAAAKFLEVVGPKVWNAIVGAKAGAGSPEEFRLALEAKGFDMDEINEALRGGLRDTEAADLGVDALARIADAKNLPEPVDLTAGQATRDIPLWRAEDLARNTGFGDRVGGEAIELSKAQQRALNANADILLGEFKSLGTRAERSASVQNQLARQRAAAEAKVSNAYKLARDAGPVNIAVAPVRNMLKGMRAKVVRKGASNISAPLTIDKLDALEAIINRDGVTAVKLKLLEDWRSSVTQTLNGASGADRMGLKSLLVAFDASATRSLADGVTKGDANAIGLWRNAIAARREFGEKWEADNILSTLTVSKGDRSGEIKVAAADVMDHILGTSTFGSKGSAAREVTRLKKVLGPDSDEFNQIRAEGLVMLLGFDPSVRVAGRNMPTNLVNNVNKMLKGKHQAAFRALYTERQRNAIFRLARVLETVNVPPGAAGTMNRSGTGYTNVTAASAGIERIQKAVEVFGRQFGAGGGVASRVVVRFLTGAADDAKEAAVKRSLQGLPPVPKPAPAYPGVGGALGEEAGVGAFAQ
mgnify:CR=1 FL=1